MLTIRQAHEVSNRNEDFTGKWTRNQVCYILARNMSSFCPCPNSLCETEFESGRLINLAEEISVQSNTQAVAWVLLDAVSLIYSDIQEKKQS